MSIARISSYRSAGQPLASGLTEVQVNPSKGVVKC